MANDTEGKENFCVAYECKDDGWEIGFYACICPDRDYIEKEWNKMKEETSQLCCPT